jgi:esterase/lipase superfamily enzyme
VFLSIQKEGYNIPVIGLSWDSNTAFSLTNVDISQRGWRIAKIIAYENGPILEKFIDRFKDECQESKLRIIAHSLGSRVKLSAIQSLSDHNNNITATSVPSKTIASVHLLGAAIDDEQVSTDERLCNDNRPLLKCSGVAIDSEVENFYSLYNPEVTC